MKLNITEDKENKALQRRELIVEVDYDGGPTPSTKTVVEELARQAGASSETVEVTCLLSSTGAARGTACAHVWATKEAMEKNMPHKRAKATAKPAA